MFIVPSVDVSSEGLTPGPISLSRRLEDWGRDGFHRIELSHHDLDLRRPSDARRIESLLREVTVEVQVSGRYESGDDIETVLGLGAHFATLGSRAADELDWLTTVAAQFPHQLLFSTSARERRVRMRGALRTRPVDLRDIAAEVAAFPLGGMIVEFPPDVDIGHAQLALLEDVAEEVAFPVLVSGGVITLGALRDLEFRGVAATIISAANLSADLDAQTLARGFAD